MNGLRIFFDNNCNMYDVGIINVLVSPTIPNFMKEKSSKKNNKMTSAKNEYCKK